MVHEWGMRGAHKDAIAGGRGEVCRVVGGQAEALVRHYNGRLREAQHIRDYLPAHCTCSILDVELTASVLHRCMPTQYPEDIIYLDIAWSDAKELPCRVSSFHVLGCYPSPLQAKLAMWL